MEPHCPLVVCSSGATVIRSDQYLRFGTHVIRGLIYEKKINKTSPLTAWSWRAEERRSLNAPRHLSPLYGEKRFVDETVMVCRHCGRGLHWDWVPPG